MNFTTDPYFVGAQRFFTQPLTPSHTNSTSDDYAAPGTPPDMYHQQMHTDDHAFANFDHYAAPAPAFGNAPPSYPGPPTPPPNQQTFVSAPGVAAAAAPMGELPQVLSGLLPPGDGTKMEYGMDDQQTLRGTSNHSEEDDLTPAQSRRKAQNRAAQRAFRERKERHLKELENKVAELEAANEVTTTENEDLKKKLLKVSNENEVLRARQGSGSGAGSLSPGAGSEPTVTGPMTYNPTDFYADLLANHENKIPSHRITLSDSGERLLAAGAMWDLIIHHPLFKRGLVDVADISNRLKSQAKCDGQGPVFEERVIVRAIEESVGSGSDELL